MIVAVERGLNDIKDGLQQMGYNIVDLGENETPDAIVYFRDGQNHSEGMLQNTLFNGESAVNGTFLINSYNKSIDEIDQILKKRSYSPLFTGFE